MSFARSDIADFSKLDIRAGRIHYRLYRQDGSMQEMDCEDTRSNRLAVSWFQIHDRWSAVNAGPTGPDLGSAAA